VAAATTWLATLAAHTRRRGRQASSTV
jgi:hypothetical protein